MRLVPVPVRKYAKGKPLPIDANFRFYVPCSITRDSIAINLDNYMISVPSYPKECPVPHPFSYTIYLGNNPFADLNTQLRSFVGGANLQVRGNVIVMKSDMQGALRPMTTQDFFFVQRMVVDFPSSRASTPPLTRSQSKKCSLLAGQGSLKQSYLLHINQSRSSPKCLALQFISMPEMALELLSWSDWSTLIAFSRISKYGRDMAQLATLYRIRSEVAPFVTRIKFQDFMDMLHRTGGGIVGSVPRLMLADNCKFMMKRKRYAPADINLLVLQGQLQEAKSFFKTLGYSKWITLTVETVYKGVVSEVIEGVRPASPGVNQATVNISECKGGLFETVVTAPITALANLITPLSVYSIYPGLIFSKKAISSDRFGVSFSRRTPSSYTFECTNAEWTAPCRFNCPAEDRRSVGDKGVGIFRWSGRFDVPVSRFEDTDYLLGENVIAWRLSMRCRNPHCRNYTPPAVF
ncbi:hypothetical protein MD484_g6187, partial [Candolleomyces efflorescens]